MAVNYDDVIAQLTAAGLEIDHLAIGKMQRCKVEGDREKRGWYAVHEVTLSGGDVVLVGSYGVWRGDDNGATKIALSKVSMTPEQKAAIRARLAEDRRKAAAARKADADRAANAAEAKWRECVAEGEHDYLTRKGIHSHGLRYGAPGAVIEWEHNGKTITSPVGGALCVPMMDVGGRVHGLQWILSRSLHGERIKRIERDKEYWPQGMDKVGHFHMVGMPTWIVLIAEGYATAASLHEATGLPVAVAFDAGNLQPVAAALHKRYPKARVLICGDDDAYGRCGECKAPVEVSASACPSCGKPHGRDNAGQIRASTAALAVGGGWILPRFADGAARWAKFASNGHKTTDFNDLHAIEGLAAVRLQVEDALSTLGWQAPSPAARAAAPQTGGEGKSALRPIDTLDELLERYALVYGQDGTVFDFAERCLVKLGDMRDLCISRELHRRWAEHPGKRIVRMAEVGFDPTERDTAITCNTWAGWPSKPKDGCCELLLELLQHLCSAEDDPVGVYQWLIKWLAYPLQHAGAKMQSAVVMHGAQGTGKSKFFKTMIGIYGKYGLTINQSAVENHRNTWLSSRLFILAEEVVARQELYQVKNALKDLVTGDTVYVDPKFVNAYAERNHVNLVFISNETMPIVLEDDDRRHLVVWTPDEGQPPEFYKELQREIDDGGAAALHAHLMQVDLTGFDTHTRPPMTKAKRELIDLSTDSTSRFFSELASGDIDGIKPMPALSKDLFAVYRAWCNSINVKPAPMPRLLNTLHKKHHVAMVRKRYLDGSTIKGPHGIAMLPEIIDGKTKHPEQPAGSGEVAWLGESVVAFRNAVADYKGASNA